MNTTFSKKVKEEIKKHLEKNYKIKKNETYDTFMISNKSIFAKKDLRKKFVEHGSIYDPKRGYHIEYNFNNLDDANYTIKELSMYDISGKLSITSKNRYIVYIVDAATIVALLKVLGASETLNEYQNVIKEKLKIKEINSKVNFEAANIKKSADAAYMQLEDIKILLKQKKMEELDENIQEVIKARKKYPTLSLTELAEKMGNVTKSALNHRFIKIRKMIGR